MQCRHEIAENNGIFCTELIDRGHFFYMEVTNDVLRNGSIDYKSEETNDRRGCNAIVELPMVKAVTMSAEEDLSMHVADSTERFHEHERPETLVTLSQSSWSRSKSKEVSYKDLQNLY